MNVYRLKTRNIISKFIVIQATVEVVYCLSCPYVQSHFLIGIYAPKMKQMDMRDFKMTNTC